jgi:hypothetical protein
MKRIIGLQKVLPLLAAKQYPMDDNNSFRLSWPILFIVTSASFLLFNFFVKMLEGIYSPLLFRISIIAGILGAVSWLGSLLSSRKKTGHTS